jgi:hypothetical protein
MALNVDGTRILGSSRRVRYLHDSFCVWFFGIAFAFCVSWFVGVQHWCYLCNFDTFETLGLSLLPMNVSTYRPQDRDLMDDADLHALKLGIAME